MVDDKKETTLGLGERLRSARKARALTLQQAAFTLRLEESVLRALEDEHYEVLGASVFVRGHLKAYAKLLGLSEEVTLTAYRNSDPNADQPPRVTRELEKPLTTTPGPLVILAAVGFALLALLLVYLLGAGGGAVAPATRFAPSQDALPTIDTMPAPQPALVPAPAPAPVQEFPSSPVTPTATPAGGQPDDGAVQSSPQSMPEPAAEAVAAPADAPPAAVE